MVHLMENLRRMSEDSCLSACRTNGLPSPSATCPCYAAKAPRTGLLPPLRLLLLLLLPNRGVPQGEAAP